MGKETQYFPKLKLPTANYFACLLPTGSEEREVLGLVIFWLQYKKNKKQQQQIWPADLLTVHSSGSDSQKNRDQQLQ